MFFHPCAPLWPTISIYIHENWTLGKTSGINLKCSWEDLGEYVVNFMVTPWDQGMFFLNTSPKPSPPKEKNWMPHECMLNCNQKRRGPSYTQNHRTLALNLILFYHTAHRSPSSFNTWSVDRPLYMYTTNRKHITHSNRTTLTEL